MKRNFLFFSFLFLMSAFVNLSSLKAKDGQGIAYYNAGFPQSAKTLLLEELVAGSANQAETCFYLGNIYFEESKQDSASFYFKKGLAADPMSALNTIGLAMLQIKTNSVAADQDIENALKGKNKKDADLIIAAARAYLVNGRIEKASLYQERAQKAKPKYAPAFVLLGDIELAQEKVGDACRNYEQAIYFDAACKEAYIKYARAYKGVNTALSIEMLGRLKEQVPTFLLAEKELADIYYSTNDFDKAAEAYDRFLQSGNYTTQDLTKYAMTLFLSHNFAKSLEVAKIGLAKNPRNPVFNRLAMYNNTDLKQYDEAIKAADLFFNQSDKPDFSYLDYMYYGHALRETKQFDSAIVQYESALKLDSTKVDLWKDISEMYDAKSDYNNAISSYAKYMNALSADKKTPDVIIAFGKMYYSQSSVPTISAEIKKDALIKADSLFAQVASLEPDNYRGNFWRARTNSIIDEDSTKISAKPLQGLAKPFYEETAKIVEAKADPRYNSVAVECYSYLGYYYLVKEDYPVSKSYWNKILVIDPTNVTAKKALEGIK